MKKMTIYCKDFEVTDAIKKYADDKLGGLLKFMSNGDGEEVVFNLRLGKTTNHHNNGKIFYAELSIHVPHKDHEAKIEADDIYVAMDLLRDEMAEQIRAYKDKQRTISRHDAKKFKEERLSAE